MTYVMVSASATGFVAVREFGPFHKDDGEAERLVHALALTGKYESVKIVSVDHESGTKRPITGCPAVEHDSGGRDKTHLTIRFVGDPFFGRVTAQVVECPAAVSEGRNRPEACRNVLQALLDLDLEGDRRSA